MNDTLKQFFIAIYLEARHRPGTAAWMTVQTWVIDGEIV